MEKNKTVKFKVLNDIRKEEALKKRQNIIEERKKSYDDIDLQTIDDIKKMSDLVENVSVPLMEVKSKLKELNDTLDRLTLLEAKGLISSDTYESVEMNITNITSTVDKIIIYVSTV